MKKTLFMIAALLTTVALKAQTVDAVSSFPWNDGFESAVGFAAWTILDNNNSTSDNWTRTSSSSYRHSGSYAVRSSYNTSGTCSEWIISPALQLPPDAEGFILKWWVRGSVYSGNIAHYTILISISDTTIDSFTDTLYAEGYSSSTYAERNASIEDYGGQTIYVAFVHDSYNDNGLCLDDISVYCSMAPVVSLSGPTQVSEGISAYFAASLVEGSSNNLTYVWNSSMESHGLATLIVYDDSLEVLYSGGGTDTVTVVASNAYGADTATMFVQVCGGIALFPWSENFENSQILSCWTIHDLNSSTSDNWSRYYGINTSHSGSYAMRSYYNSSGNSNDWLITPPLQLPNDDGIVLKWWVRGSQFSGNTAHYTVFVSTTGTSASDFVDTLFDESHGTSEYLERSVSLDPYIGQTVYVAFVHDSYNDNGIMLDDISVYSALPPTAAISGPAAAQVGETAVFHANIIEGSTDNLTYLWSSTMVEDSRADLSVDGDSAMIEYYESGIDTILLVLSNSYGDDSVVAVIHVCGTVTEFPWSEDFSDPDALACWTLLDLNGNIGDNWQRNTSGGNSASPCVHANYGRYPAANDWLITPGLELPADADSYILTWLVRGSEYMGSTSHYTVLASTAGLDTASFTDTLLAEAYGGALALRQVGISAYSGQTVHFAFVYDSHNDNGLTLDDITVRSASEPVVALYGPTSAFTGEPVLFAAELTEGSSDGLTYVWSNTLVGSTLTPVDDTLTVRYTLGGTDTIRVIATNFYGTDTTFIVLTVIDCPAIATFPWEEGFEDASTLDCWAILDLDGINNDDWMRNTFSSNAHSGSASIRSYYNSSAAANDWLVTPAVAIPAAADGLSLTWWVRGTGYMSNISHYAVLLSSAGIDTAAFTDTLFAESYNGAYASRAVSLEDYAGQTVRIAFVHDSYNDNGLYLDDIAVRTVLLPVVTASGPLSTFTNAPTAFAATILEGSETGLVYTWSNTLTGSILTPFGDSLSVLYTLGGTDTLIVTATNAYGSATDTLIVQVVDCPAISSFPWSEGFEDGASALQCWSIVDNNNFADDNWMLVNNYDNAYEGGRCIGASYRENGTNDDYIISPAITLPANADDLYLSYYVAGGEYYGNVTTYQTLVSTTGIAVTDFTDILVSEAYDGDYVRRSFSLAPYAGQTIHFAFHHISYDAVSLRIDNVSIDTNGTFVPTSCPEPEIVTVAEAETSITVSWTGTAFSYEVAIASGTWIAPASGTSTLSASYTFTALTPATSYTIGVRSRCNDGSYSGWNTLQAVTASTACQVPTALEAGAIAFDGATLGWVPAGNESSWEVNIHASQGIYDTFIVAGSTSLAVVGLAHGCTYSYKVRALCSATSHSDWSPAANFTTLSCDAPTGLTASDITHAAATLTWDANGAAAYEVSLGVGTTADNGILFAAAGNNLVLNQLELNTTYSVYVRSRCTDNIVSDWSLCYTFTTSEVSIDEVCADALTLHPNPAHTTVILDGLEPGATISVVDLNGREVSSLPVSRSSLPIDVSLLPPGTYFVRVAGGQTSVIRKLIVR